ncbi:MAG TPA: hypothetical protein VHS97_07885, partial [Isosphaeraceae bacterium]|nr:hypothetical protein [Isosphaeraceae bacterium]
MKNFVRLVQFAWRYKIRFGLSVCCAVMVALLFFTELGAVYPLLHILFGSQNPQRWISEKIVGLETDILILQAREEEARQVLTDAQSSEPHNDELRQRFQRVHENFERTEADLRTHERRFGVGGPKENADPFGGREAIQADEAKLRRDHRVAEARWNELRECVDFFTKRKVRSLTIRQREIQQEISDQEKMLNRCKLAQPFVIKY